MKDDKNARHYRNFDGIIYKSWALSLRIENHQKYLYKRSLKNKNKKIDFCTASFSHSAFSFEKYWESLILVRSNLSVACAVSAKFTVIIIDKRLSLVQLTNILRKKFKCRLYLSCLWKHDSYIFTIQKKYRLIIVSTKLQIFIDKVYQDRREIFGKQHFALKFYFVELYSTTLVEMINSF